MVKFAAKQGKSMENEKPQIVVKKKNIQQVLDFSLDNGIEFTVKPKLSGDEWIVDLNIRDIKMAVVLGIFLRENRLEMIGITPYQAKTTASAKPATKSKRTKTNDLELIQDNDEEEAEEDLNFANQSNLEANNEVVQEPVAESIPQNKLETESVYETTETFSNENSEFDEFELKTETSTTLEYQPERHAEEMEEINDEIEAFGSDRNNGVSLF